MKTIHTILISFVSGVIGAALVVNGIIPVPRPEVTPAVTVGEGLEQQTVELASNHEAQVVNAAKEASPAVVSIIISKDVPVIERFFEESPQSPFGSFFDPFGQSNVQVPRLRQNGTERQEIGGGTGFLVSADGMIVTNRHVVNDTEAEYTVFLQDGTSSAASVLARDTINDIAVIKIEAESLPFLIFGDSDKLQPGQTVIAIGNALSEFRNSVSVGVISGLARSITAGNGQGQSEELEEVIQTDAAINPGNSGGPLLNTRGQVIGVNVAVALGSENIGFALPSNLVTDIVTGVQENGRIVRPFIGVRYAVITPVMQERNNLPVDTGVLLIRGEELTDLAVLPDSPAAKAGLAEGDIIIAIDGVPLTADTTLASAIRKKKVGDTITLTVIQNGEEKSLPVTLEEAPQ